MAWQTPKVNWAAPDGVRNTDLNRIEGNILELYNGAAVRDAITLYVATTGNDTTGAGTSGSPFATANKALSMLPKNLNAKNVTINIDINSGLYSENVVVSGFTSPITFNFTSIGKFRSLVVDNCVLLMTGQQCNVTPGGSGATAVTIRNNALVVCSNIFYVGAGTVGIDVKDGSRFVVYNTMTISNTASFGLNVSGGSIAYVATLAGTSNVTGVSANTGGIVSYGGSSIAATTKYMTNTGGRIYSGSQASIPNY